ncbi:MAG: AraC family transcriptional regulator [Verrucomicrobiales bacterium]
MQLFKRNQSKTNHQEKLGGWPVRMRMFELVADFELTPREQPEIFIVHSGKAVVDTKTGKGRQVIANGTAVVSLPGGHFNLVNVQALTMTALRFLPEWLSDQSESLLGSKDSAAMWGCPFYFSTRESGDHQPQIFSLEAPVLAALESDLTVIRGELESNIPTSSLVKHTLLKILLQLAAAHGKYWRGKQHLDWPAELPKLLAMFERVAAQGKRMNIRQATEESGMKESRLSQIIEDGLGMAPMDYLERRRAQHAARQILAGETSTEAIVAQTGFTNASGLDEQMKVTFGRSTAEYRADFCG